MQTKYAVNQCLIAHLKWPFVLIWFNAFFTLFTKRLFLLVVVVAAYFAVKARYFYFKNAGDYAFAALAFAIFWLGLFGNMGF